MSKNDNSPPSAFALQGAIVRAWSTTVRSVLQNHQDNEDKKTSAEHAVRFDNIDTMLFFGYITRAKEQRIMQSTIVNALVPDNDEDDEDSLKAKRQAKRQDIKRRADALVFFRLIEREHLSKVAAQFSLSKTGQQTLSVFDEAYKVEVQKLSKKGD